MTWDEFTDLVSEIESLWPLAPQWPDETVRHTFRLSEGFDRAHLRRALKDWFDTGNHWPPQPAELLREARELARFQPSDAPALERGGNLKPLSQWLEEQGYGSVREAMQKAETL